MVCIIKLKKIGKTNNFSGNIRDKKVTILSLSKCDLGFWFESYELDWDYWQAQEDRFRNHITQSEIFDKQEIQKNIFNQGELHEN